MNKFILAAVLLLTSSVALAEGYYLSMSGGNAQIELDTSTDISGQTILVKSGYLSSNGFGAELGLSHMTTNDYFSEVDYNSGVIRERIRYGVDNVYLDGVYLDLGNDFSAISKLGLARIRVETTYRKEFTNSEEVTTPISEAANLGNSYTTAGHAYLGLRYSTLDISFDLGVDGYSEHGNSTITPNVGFTVFF